MSTEQNKALVRRTIDAINERNWAAYNEAFSPDIVLHNASMTIQGLEAHRQYVSMLFTAFPDLHFTIEDLLAEGDKVVERYTARGTHTGALMGMAPTGKQFTMTAIGINHLANDKFIEQWFNGDELGLFQQLGVIPAPGQAS